MPSSPLATGYSGGTGGADWLVLPMGKLGDPVNTFWQVFSLVPAAKTKAHREKWDLVTPPGVAANGGIALGGTALGGGSGGGEGSVVAGFEPSQYLTFSPLAISANGGKSWQQGLLPDGLLPEPSVIAEGPGLSAALVGAAADHGGEQVVIAAGSPGGSWRTLADESAIARSPAGRVCGVRFLSAVAVEADGSVLVAAACSRPGAVGIFTVRGGTVAAAAPSVPAPWSSEKVQVVALTGTAALLDAEGGASGSTLLVAWREASGSWTMSQPLGSAGDESLRAVGFGQQGSVVVLLGRSGEATEVAAVSPSSGSSNPAWQAYPTPPASAEDVVLVGSAPELATVELSTLTLYALERPGSSGRVVWRENQVIQVPIEYSSSS